MVFATGRISGPPHPADRRSHRAPAGRSVVPQLPARWSDGFDRGLPARATRARERDQNAGEERSPASGALVRPADEQIPSGESLLRNLLLGTMDADRLGGRLDVLYSPDAFGHPGILPTLAREFGIKFGVLWRGLGRRGDPEHGGERDLFRWRGP